MDNITVKDFQGHWLRGKHTHSIYYCPTNEELAAWDLKFPDRGPNTVWCIVVVKGPKGIFNAGRHNIITVTSHKNYIVI